MYTVAIMVINPTTMPRTMPAVSKVESLELSSSWFLGWTPPVFASSVDPDMNDEVVESASSSLTGVKPGGGTVSTAVLVRPPVTITTAVATDIPPGASADAVKVTSEVTGIPQMILLRAAATKMRA